MNLFKKTTQRKKRIVKLEQLLEEAKTNLREEKKQHQFIVDTYKFLVENQHKNNRTLIKHTERLFAELEEQQRNGIKNTPIKSGGQ